MGFQMALPESPYENEQAIRSTLYNSYWIRIKKTNSDIVPWRTDDPFDKILPYENWADFRADEDDRQWLHMYF